MNLENNKLVMIGMVVVAGLIIVGGVTIVMTGGNGDGESPPDAPELPEAPLPENASRTAVQALAEEKFRATITFDYHTEQGETVTRKIILMNSPSEIYQNDTYTSRTLHVYHNRESGKTLLRAVRGGSAVIQMKSSEQQIPYYDSEDPRGSFEIIVKGYETKLERTYTLDDGTTVGVYTVTGKQDGERSARDRSHVKATHGFTSADTGPSELNGEIHIAEDGTIRKMSYTAVINGSEYAYNFTISEANYDPSVFNQSWIENGLETAPGFGNLTVEDNYAAITMTNGKLKINRANSVFVLYGREVAQQRYTDIKISETVTEGDTLYFTEKDGELEITTTKPENGNLPGDSENLWTFYVSFEDEDGNTYAWAFNRQP